MKKGTQTENDEYVSSRDALIAQAEKRSKAIMKGGKYGTKKEREAAWNKIFHREMNALAQEAGISWISP